LIHSIQQHMAMLLTLLRLWRRSTGALLILKTKECFITIQHRHVLPILHMPIRVVKWIKMSRRSLLKRTQLVWVTDLRLESQKMEDLYILHFSTAVLLMKGVMLIFAMEWWLMGSIRMFQPFSILILWAVTVLEVLLIFTNNAQRIRDFAMLSTRVPKKEPTKESKKEPTLRLKLPLLKWLC
jgi:hypothetical protein